MHEVCHNVHNYQVPHESHGPLSPWGRITESICRIHKSEMFQSCYLWAIFRAKSSGYKKDTKARNSVSHKQTKQKDIGIQRTILLLVSLPSYYKVIPLCWIYSHPGDFQTFPAPTWWFEIYGLISPAACNTAVCSGGV